MRPEEVQIYWQFYGFFLQRLHDLHAHHTYFSEHVIFATFCLLLVHHFSIWGGGVPVTVVVGPRGLQMARAGLNVHVFRNTCNPLFPKLCLKPGKDARAVGWHGYRGLTNMPNGSPCAGVTCCTGAPSAWRSRPMQRAGLCGSLGIVPFHHQVCSDGSLPCPSMLNVLWILVSRNPAH